MKSKLLISLRQAVEQAPLPALLALLLVLAFLFQLLMPITATLPDVALERKQPITLSPVNIAPIGRHPAITQRQLFAPSASGADEAGEQGGASLTLLGVARSAGRAAAVLSGPDGRAVSLNVGGQIAGWRVAAIGRNSIVLTGPAGKVMLTIGQSLDSVQQQRESSSQMGNGVEE